MKKEQVIQSFLWFNLWADSMGHFAWFNLLYYWMGNASCQWRAWKLSCQNQVQQ